ALVSEELLWVKKRQMVLDTLQAARQRTHSEKVLLHAESRFHVSKPPSEPAEISRQLRTFLRIEDQRLRMAHRRGQPGSQTAAARSAVLDLVVQRAYRAATQLAEAGGFPDETQNGCAVVALGGYG